MCLWLFQSLDAAKRERLKEQEGQEQQHVRVKDELRQVKAERNSLEAKCHDLETVSVAINHNTKKHSPAWSLKYKKVHEKVGICYTIEA